MNKLKIIPFVLAVTLPLVAQDLPKVIAHRGYWQTYGSTQNSICSFERAAEIGAYGSEFDVHMTSDSVLILFHDNTIHNLNIQEVPYSRLMDIKLPNGECVPTLREFLEATRKTGSDIKLIFELKPHATPERNREAARRSVEMIREKKLTYRTEFITFSLDAGKELIRLAPEIPVYYLNGELSPQELKNLGFAGLDYHFNVMRKNPQWFKEAKKLGLGVNVWTINDPAIIKEMADQGADFITTDIPSQAIIQLNHRKNE
ncbi:MAG: glycerophosphodiester phosphodiesterase [Tannerella sp.]|jgi:glycerophosphoryl diester phosphodiesterase|nr:glycerophosphodiester phosphodiesterase [Tannerella sp.]